MKIFKGKKLILRVRLIKKNKKLFWTNKRVFHMSFPRIILEGDSLLMVNALNKTGLNWSMNGQILADIQEVLLCFQSWKICHTERRANSVAHQLAKEGVQNATDRIWLHCIP